MLTNSGVARCRQGASKSRPSHLKGSYGGTMCWRYRATLDLRASAAFSQGTRARPRPGPQRAPRRHLVAIGERNDSRIHSQRLPVGSRWLPDWRAAASRIGDQNQAGTSKSGCVSPSTRHHPNHPTRQAEQANHHPNPAQCQPKTVCVPSVVFLEQRYAGEIARRYGAAVESPIDPFNRPKHRGDYWLRIPPFPEHRRSSWPRNGRTRVRQRN